MNGNKSLGYLILSAAGVATLGMAASANAQPAQQTAAAERNPTMLEEIIVTAQRRAERLEDIPMSIIALNASFLERSGITNIHDLGRVTPGVQINFGGANTQTAIRGVTTLTNGTGVENNVAMYVDGFYEPNSTFINTDFANIAGIEVLKGPQGTLYGRNATGGAILINTLGPSDETTGSINARYGKFEDLTLSGFVSGPISDSIRYSIAGYNRESDGYIKLLANPLTGEGSGDAAPVTQHSVRARLQFDLTDSLVMDVGYNYALVDDARGQLFTTFEHVPGFLPGPPLRAERPGTASFNFKNEVRNMSNQGTLKFEWETAVGTLTSRTSYTERDARQSFDFDGTFANMVYTTTEYEQDTFQHGMDFTTSVFDGFDLLFGAFYYDDELKLDPEIGQSFFDGGTPFAPGPILNQLFGGQDTEALAAYFDVTYQLSNQLSLNAGGRYSREKKSVSMTTLSGAGDILLPTTERSITWNRFTPRVSLRYELSPATNIYASYSTGFRAGTYNLAGAASPELVVPTDPEKINAYEIGFKTVGERVRFDIAAFFYDYTDLNASVTVESPLCAGQPGCNISTVFSNAKKAEIYGIDGQIFFYPFEGMTLRAGGAWLHAEYKDFKNAVGTELNPITGTNVGSQQQDWSGEEMARSPEFSGNIGFDYEFSLAASSMTISSTLSYTDSYVVSNPSLFCSSDCSGGRSAKQRFRTKSYSLLSAQATWHDPSERFSVGVYGNNLTNEKYSATYNGAAFGNYNTLGEPRTYGVRLGYTF